MAVTLHYARLVFEPAQSVYDLHCDLSQALGKRDAAGWIHRTDVDREARPHKRIVLVQSAAPGDWSALRERAKRALVACETKQRVWSFEAGERYRFFLRANATHAKKATLRELAGVGGDDFRKARGKRVAVRGEDQLLAWLGRQGERCGFALESRPFADEGGGTKDVASVRIAVSPGRDVVWQSRTRKEHRGKHAGTDFEGILVVTDAAKIAAALAKGIGPGKAFGFGLLSLARLANGGPR